MLVTVNLLAEGLVSGAELLLCLWVGEWARVGRDRAADADIQEELARKVRMIKDCDIWSLAVFFVVRSKYANLRCRALARSSQRPSRYTPFVRLR